METIKFYLNYLDSHFTGYAPVIRITLFVVMFLLILYLSSLIRLLIINRQNKKRDKRWKEINRKYHDQLKDILFSQKDLSQIEIENKLSLQERDIKKRWQKEMFTNLLLSIKGNGTSTGDTKTKFNIDNFNEVLTMLKIEAFWINEISSGGTGRKKRGLRKLEELTNDVSSSIVASLLHHRNHNLRKLSRSEYIKFVSDDAFKFMEKDFDHKFNRLDEIRIHDALKRKSIENELPLFTRWIKHTKNEDYKCFLIGEVAYFKQHNSVPFLLQLFKETDRANVRAEIAKTLGILQCEEALPVFIEEYAFSKLFVQNNIIVAIGNIGKKESLPFLHQLHDVAYNEEMRIKIKEALQKCGEQNNIYLKELQTAQ